MAEALSFQRARKPEEREFRREAILTAAAELFDAEGPQGAGLNAIAARAGFTKSNVYRYFESREEVLLSLFLAELDGFVGDFESGVGAIAENDIDALARLAADGFIARPRFCALMTILISVLEQNVSEDRIKTLKRAVSSLYTRVAVALQSRLPAAGLEDCGWVGASSATFVAGLWPSARPSSTAARVMELPEFAHLKPKPDRDVARVIRALLASIIAV
jgi:AcrR family transcriptional regulator